MSEPAQHPPGLGDSLRRVGDTALSLLQNRLELLFLELKEEQYRFIEILLWAAALIFLGIMAAIVVTFTIVSLFPNQAAGLLIGFSVLYVGLAILSFYRLRAQFKRSMPFSGTLAEIKKDLECLRSQK